MIKNRALNIAEPTSEGSHLAGKPNKQEQLSKTTLSKKEKIVIGNVSGRSKSDSSLEPASTKKRRNIASGSKPFTIHEDVADDKLLSTSAQPSTSVEVNAGHIEEVSSALILPESKAVTESRSQSYWQVEAENLRKKLEIALEENRMVWEELDALKSVNRQMKEALDDAALIADVLREQMDKEDARVEVGTQTDMET
ncbi:hypothetical protein RvY_15512-2 [Ramazzottius varieornatus]|uniref:Geminin n=1 Tax=Ramazzottius varieornatus TaxID=947166 RepID=A0A1D1W1Z0_RAMVA|nr:hypothetical protein RvY_15512-2 [Ramazzottius varieornatus]